MEIKKQKPVLSIIVILLVCTLVWAGSSLCTGKTEERVKDLDNDLITESYLLQKDKLVIRENGQKLWETPPEWKVQSFLLTDANNDGREDLLMVVWKKGSFGKHKPFWISQNDNNLSNHLFLFDLVQKKFKSVWMSSALDKPIKSIKVEDSDKDGKNELQIKEGNYLPFADFKKSCPPYQDTLWQWKGWGFFRIDAQEAGALKGIVGIISHDDYLF